MSISNAELYDMIAVYFECHQNAAIASRIYSVRYPDRRHYGKQVFERKARRLRETGSFHRPCFKRRSRGMTEDNSINVLALIQQNPHISSRQISIELNIPKTTVLRILKHHRLHPYHVVLHQALHERDFDARLDYCNWMLGLLEEQPHIMSKILWTDEATFNSAGGVNLHNMHYWAEENPHWIQEVQLQGRWSLNVWCGIVDGKIVGPYFFDRTLNGETYLDFLENQLPVLLEDISLQTRRDMILQHDGCPAHFSRRVRDYLYANYPNKWIGRGSIFSWPARSPDLTCLDFYLWGRLKDLVYQTRPTTRDDMKQRIINAINSISTAEIEAAVMSTRERLHLCVDNDGKQFEHLIGH